MDEQGEYIESKINECFNKSEPVLLFGEPEKLKLYMPKIAINMFVEYINTKTTVKFDSTEIIKYRSIEIKQGYEMAVILVHDDYPLWLTNDLISKVKL